MHNLRYYQRLMGGLREAVAGRRLDGFGAEFYARRGVEWGPDRNQGQLSATTGDADPSRKA
jgi:queuine/archaeosine tRNA-ribosyltransferase